MYCKNCGKEIKETAKFCPACGYKVSEEQKEQKEQDEEKKPNWKKRLAKKKKVIFILLGILLVIGIIFGIDRKIKSGSAENIAAKACRDKFGGIYGGYYDYDDLLVPQYKEKKSETYENAWDEKESELDTLYDGYHNYSCTYALAADTYEGDDAWLQKCRAQLALEYDYPLDEIKEIKVVTVNVKVNGEIKLELHEEEFNWDATCVKIGNKWYVHPEPLEE